MYVFLVKVLIVSLLTAILQVFLVESFLADSIQILSDNGNVDYKTFSQSKLNLRYDNFFSASFSYHTVNFWLFWYNLKLKGIKISL